MCGRFAQSVPLGKLNKIDLYDEMCGIYTGSYNTAPSQQAFTISRSGEKRVFKPMRWGLIPSWTKPDKTFSGLINARFDSITEKPSFRNSYKNKRCIVPVTGFFEWEKKGKEKIPYFINSGRDIDGDFIPMLLCGVYDIWTTPQGEDVETFSIITTEASGRMKTIHDRMPLILNQGNVLLWIGDNYNHDMHKSIISSFDAESLDIYPVSDYVNSYMNNSVQCIEPIGV